MASDTPKRLDWDTYFMRIAQLVAERSTCNRAKVGAVIVRNRSILATGYNGSPAGLPHCHDIGCEVYTTITPDGEEITNCYRTIHAEMNAIAQAAKNGTAIDGASIYVTASPCTHCLKVLINVGMEKIYYGKPYKLHTVQRIIDTSGIGMIHVDVPPLPPEVTEMPE
jgi:dCMP deaminase